MIGVGKILRSCLNGAWGSWDMAISVGSSPWLSGCLLNVKTDA